MAILRGKELKQALLCCLCAKEAMCKFTLTCNHTEQAQKIAETFVVNLPRRGMLVKFLFCKDHQEAGRLMIRITQELGGYATQIRIVALRAAIKPK